MPLLQNMLSNIQNKPTAILSTNNPSQIKLNISPNRSRETSHLLLVSSDLKGSLTSPTTFNRNTKSSLKLKSKGNTRKPHSLNVFSSDFKFSANFIMNSRFINRNLTSDLPRTSSSNSNSVVSTMLYNYRKTNSTLLPNQPTMSSSTSVPNTVPVVHVLNKTFTSTAPSQPLAITPSAFLFNTPTKLPSSNILMFSKYLPGCSSVLYQIPDVIPVTEHDQEKLLFTTVHGTSLNISYETIYPAKVSSNLHGHFRLHLSNKYTTNVILTKPIDIEQLYHDYKTDVNTVVMKITCSGSGVQSKFKLVNITVEDIDDNGPVFEHSEKSTCAIPLFTAGASEEFVGKLYLSPGSIHAVDGDLFHTNIVSYTFLHGDPMNYHQYFVIDFSTGVVNKTSNINATDPHDFVMIVQATETSSIQRSRVAVLTVSVSLPYIPPKSNPYRANKTVITVLQILSVVVILGFTLGFIHIVRHRNRQCQVESSKELSFTNTDKIEDIEEFMIATSTNLVITHTAVELKQPEPPVPEPTLLSVPTPDSARTPSQSPVSTRKVNVVLPEKTYRMIYGKRARQIVKKTDTRFK